MDDFLKNEDIKTIAEFENGDRSIVISEKNGRIIIAQKKVLFNREQEPQDMYFKHPLSLPKSKMIELVKVLVNLI